jgi:hypothetical protein
LIILFIYKYLACQSSLYLLFLFINIFVLSNIPMSSLGLSPFLLELLKLINEILLNGQSSWNYYLFIIYRLYFLCYFWIRVIILIIKSCRLISYGWSKFDDYKSFDFSTEKMKIAVFLYTFYFSVKFNNMFFRSILCFCLIKIVSLEILLSKKALN